MSERKYSMTIRIKYHNPNIAHAEQVEGSDWIDLRAAETVELKPFEYKVISLGVSMSLPTGYEAHLAPRSSTYEKFGIIQSNSIGVIDNTFRGDDDIWGFPAIALRHTVIHEGDRICQFRIMKKMERVKLKPVESMNNKSRGGFGSTGTN